MDKETRAISRLPPLNIEAADPILASVFEDTLSRGGSVINLHLAVGHAPHIAKARRALANALRNEATTSRLLREMIIMRTAQLLDGDYELNQHYPMALAAGISQAQLDALKDWSKSDLFDAQQRAVLAYVDKVSDGGNVDDPTYEAFAQFFTAKEIVEITVTIVSYYANVLLTKALKIEVEKDGRVTALGKFD